MMTIKFDDPLLDGLEEYHAITPLRLIEPAKKNGFTGTTMNFKNTKTQNADLIKKAKNLIGFWDDQFLELDKSIGTKVEFYANTDKFYKWYYFDGQNWTEKSPDITNKNLPSWTEYQQGF